MEITLTSFFKQFAMDQLISLKFSFQLEIKIMKKTNLKETLCIIVCSLLKKWIEYKMRNKFQTNYCGEGNS